MKYQSAVDLILQFAGETPVNSPNEHPLQGVITRWLDSSITREQLMQWWFNKDEDIILQPNTLGKVQIGSQLKQLVFANRNYTARGQFVYDKQNQTYLIGQNVEVVEATRELEWDELPELMQQWCMYQAAKYYILGTIGDSGLTKELKLEAQRTYVLLNTQDIKEKNLNIFNTPQIARARAGRFPYIRR